MRGAIAASLLVTASIAREAVAQTSLGPDRLRSATMLARSVPAPRSALELAFTLGYAQGVGSLDGTAVQDVANVGAGLDLGIGFRISPHLSVGAFGTGAIYHPVPDDSSVQGLAGGVEATWHFQPYHALDPILALGVGYRGLWETSQGSSRSWQGFELARVTIGVDYRLSPEFSVGPELKVDLTTMSGGESTRGTFFAGGLSAFVLAGVTARFDFFGTQRGRSVASR